MGEVFGLMGNSSMFLKQRLHPDYVLKINVLLKETLVTLGLLSNKQHSFEAKGEPLLIKATVPHEQIK